MKVQIPQDVLQSISYLEKDMVYKKASELDYKFSLCAGGSKDNCIRTAANAIALSGYSACLVAGAQAI